MTPEERRSAAKRVLAQRELARREAAKSMGVSRETMTPLEDFVPTPYEPPIPQPRLGPAEPFSPTRSAAQFGLAAIEGAPFNFGEEVGSVGSTIAGQVGVPGFSPNYAENLAQSRETLNAMPGGVRLAGNLAGGIGTGIGTALTTGVTSLKGLTALSAAEGALAGAGAGETPEQRLVGAGIGAPAGALFGFAVPKTIQGLAGLVNRARSGMTRAESKAAQKIMQNLERDLISPDAAMQQLRAVEGATLADLPFARNTLGLARAVESSPGPGAASITKTLAERQIGRPERIRDAVKQIISNKDFALTQRFRIANRRETANRLYRIARQRGILSSEKLNEILERPAIKNVIGRLQQNIVTPEGTQLRKLPRNNIEVIDALYKDLVEKSFTKSGDPVSGLSGRSINQIRMELRDELAELAPEYALALQKYSGDKALEEALQAGADAFRGRDRDLITPGFVQSLGEAEKEQFLVGLARAAQEGIDSGASPVSAVKRLMTPKNQAVIEAATGDRAAAKAFQDAMARELQFAATERAVIGGSPTARIQAERADAAANVLDLGLEAARGNVGQATRSGIDMLLAGMRKGRPAGQLDPGVSEALSRMLVTPTQIPSPGQNMLRQALNRSLATQRLSALGGLGATTGTTTAGAQSLMPGSKRRRSLLDLPSLSR
ncbi:MAG: hypothetical protein ACR2RF_32360 [Geminicoccaceae bacterium]